LELYPSLAATQQQVEDERATNKITANDEFRLINVIFSGELAEIALSSEEAATRAELDAGLVGHKSPFWKMVESRFNSGFPPEGVDGMTFADLMHHIYPLFHYGDTRIDPSAHGQFSAEKLMSVWTELLKEYDTVIVNFTKSGNHDSSFTKAAMVTLNVTESNKDTDSITSNSLNDDDCNEGDDDEFGMETGGWCCFANSLPIVYLRMWLNEKPNLTSSVTRQIPQDVQLDIANADESKKKRKASDPVSRKSTADNKQQRKTPSEAIADAFVGYMKYKETEAAVQPNSITKSLGEDQQSFMKCQSVKEKIELVEKQIAVVSRRIQQSQSDEQRARFSAALQQLENELDELVILK
jgi:hypothetical protein